MKLRNLFEEGVRVEDPALADGEEEEDGDDAEGGLHLRPHVDSDQTDDRDCYFQRS